jgi:hypothetical protein
VRARLGDASIPCNFSATLPFHDPNQPQRNNNQQPGLHCGDVLDFDRIRSQCPNFADFVISPQTAAFLRLLELPDLFSQHFNRRPAQSSSVEQLVTFNPDEIALDEPAPVVDDGVAVDLTYNPDEIDLS